MVPAFSPCGLISELLFVASTPECSVCVQQLPRKACFQSAERKQGRLSKETGRCALKDKEEWGNLEIKRIRLIACVRVCGRNPSSLASWLTPRKSIEQRMPTHMLLLAARKYRKLPIPWPWAYKSLKATLWDVIKHKWEITRPTYWGIKAIGQ